MTEINQLRLDIDMKDSPLYLCDLDLVTDRVFLQCLLQDLHGPTEITLDLRFESGQLQREEHNMISRGRGING